MLLSCFHVLVEDHDLCALRVFFESLIYIISSPITTFEVPREGFVVLLITYFNFSACEKICVTSAVLKTKGLLT
jgi:hypothetical protein